MSHTPPCYGARQGERVILDFVTATADIFLTPPSYGHLPYILRCKTPRKATGHGRGEGEMYFPFASAPILYATPRNATGHGKGGVWE